MKANIAQFVSLVILLLSLFVSITVTGQSGEKKTVHLYLSDTTVNYEKSNIRAIAINGSIPGPELHFNLGDTAEIFVHNGLRQESSIHWHGLILPNEHDGVPYLTTSPIKAGTTHRYYFPIVQTGTYWYHSHTGLQEQIGMYGAFILHDKKTEDIPEKTLLLSDWSDENPKQIDRSLHNATDWYTLKKNAIQSYVEAIQSGRLAVKWESEWKRMHAMDVSDVFYDKMLVNGQLFESLKNAQAGDSIRLRIINGSASTYFWLQFGGGKVWVIANDGAAIVPVQVDRLIVGVSETYDLVVVMPESKTFEFRATSEDRTRFTSLFLGQGDTIFAPTLGRLDYFAGMEMMNGMMNLDGSMDPMGMKMTNQKMDMNSVMYPEYSHPLKEGDHPYHTGIPKTLNYGMLRAPEITTLPDSAFTEYYFELTGNMNRYVWTINNKTVSESDVIKIMQGENVRIILYNNSMMRHPMHLHGHFFRVLNGHGEHSPLKTVIDIMPMETDTIEFHGSEYGNWFFHCHILYHMMSGMGRLFTYEDGPKNPQVMNQKRALKMIYMDDRMYHFRAEVDLLSTGSDGFVQWANTRNKLSAEWRIGIKGDYETETHISRYFGKMQYLSAYAGSDYRNRKAGEENSKDNRQVFCVGINYLLPGLIESDLRLDHTGKLRFQLHRDDLALTKRIRLQGMWNSDLEFMVGASYILTKYWSLSAHYDSDMGMGGGIRLTY